MTDLVKTLSVTQGSALMLNIVVGAGLLTLPGLVVANVGNHAFWAWVVCAATAVPLLFVFIIMGRRFPHAGGVAHFAAMAFGSAAYCVASFIFLGAVAFGLPAIALTGGYYVAEILPGSPVFFAAAFIIFATLANFISATMAARFAAAIASAIVVSLLIFVGIGFSAIDLQQGIRDIPPIVDVNISLVFQPFMMIFFAFTGWEVAAGTAEEFKNPKRDFPRAMIISFIAACLLYFAMVFIVQNTPLADSDSYESSFVSIAGRVLGDAGELAVALLAAAIILANLMGAIWAVSRMVFSLAREGYLPFVLTKNKNGLPIFCVLVTAVGLLMVLSLDWLGLLGINNMLALAGQNFFILYGVSSLALFMLSNNIAEKTLAVTAVLIVLVLLVAEGTSVFYPLGLSALALITWKIKNQKTRPLS